MNRILMNSSRSRASTDGRSVVKLHPVRVRMTVNQPLQLSRTKGHDATGPGIVSLRPQACIPRKPSLRMSFEHVRVKKNRTPIFFFQSLTPCAPLSRTTAGPSTSAVILPSQMEICLPYLVT